MAGSGQIGNWSENGQITRLINWANNQMNNWKNNWMNKNQTLERQMCEVCFSIQHPYEIIRNDLQDLLPITQKLFPSRYG